MITSLLALHFEYAIDNITRYCLLSKKSFGFNEMTEQPQFL